ncbi:hypothetical protein [Asticcacaulis excentricus]|uniref:Lipoprotein n=1 Tax=Asticcacaulis excentricus TaxID=78587 RepID=A0A3G9G4N0_9CAUL|nr:hypothetical protein [Asticcacaulis excentricus]BBF82260.1 hypothetical protein EM6_2892 [Asticcacaulis excentricus]
MKLTLKLLAVAAVAVTLSGCLMYLEGRADDSQALQPKSALTLKTRG